MSADVAGYSRLMASDEVATVRALQAAREHTAVCSVLATPTSRPSASWNSASASTSATSC